MTDPDAGGGSPLGVDAGSGSINPEDVVSSTRGTAVTNTGRGDLGGGLGPITGEVRTTNTAGPDVNPDADSMEGGGSLRAPAPEDGVNPDLVHGLGPLQPPTDDGVNPYAAGRDAAATTEGTAGGSNTGTPPGTVRDDVVAGPGAHAGADGSPSPGYNSGPRPPGQPDGAWAAATASSETAPAAPTVTVVGSGSGGTGIQSTVAGTDDVLGMAAAAPVATAAPAVDASTRAAPIDDAPPPAESVGRAAPAPDLVAAGLAADLGADPGPVVHDLGDAPPGVGSEHPGDLALDDDDGTFDDA